MTANTVLLSAHDDIVFGVIVMSIEGALVDTYLTLDAPFRISFN
jgi:hypothetical protein